MNAIAVEAGRERAASYATAAEMLAALDPIEPVYCLYPHVLERVARQFLAGFPGRVLYAVKANPEPRILRMLHAAGVRHFDAASVAEIALVLEHCPAAICYFMAPVRLRGAAGRAFHDHGVRHFVVDHADELADVLRQVRAAETTIFVRMEAHHAGAIYDLSSKFGASAEETVELLRVVEAAGAAPALAFNVGSLVLEPQAYAAGLGACSEVLRRAAVPVRLLDVGGGFPRPYPGLETPPVAAFFAAIAEARTRLPLAADAELLAEPGRALVADGLSLVAQVLLRRGDRLYLNDGIWHSLIEPVISHGLVQFPTRVYRSAGNGIDLVEGGRQPFTLFGPTCDSLDRLPEPFPLPGAIRAGDWIELGMLGAYSVANRTRFNGFYPDTFVSIDDPASLPPGVG